MNDQQLPGPGGFFEVEFWDISACGFSFFIDQLPKFDTLVAALGRPPALSHFSARVMRVARMTQDDSTRVPGRLRLHQPHPPAEDAGADDAA